MSYLRNRTPTHKKSDVDSIISAPGLDHMNDASGTPSEEITTPRKSFIPSFNTPTDTGRRIINGIDDTKPTVSGDTVKLPIDLNIKSTSGLPLTSTSIVDTYGMPSVLQKLLAEVFGTFVLVFFGCGSVCALVYTGALVGVGQATTVWTLGASLAIYSTGVISGGHLNPAVSLSFAMMRPRDFPWTLFAPYCIAQLLGAFLAGAVNFGMFSTAIANFEKENSVTRGTESTASAVGFGAYWSADVSGAPQALLIEMLGTAILTFVIFSATHKNNNVPPSAVPAIVGIAIGSIIAIIGSLSGGAINPARDMGPRLITAISGWGGDSFKGAWVYTLGPMIGGPVGALFAEKMYGDENHAIKSVSS